MDPVPAADAEAHDDAGRDHGELIRSIERLDTPPNEFCTGALQDRLDAAHLQGVRAVCGVVGRELGVDLAQEAPDGAVAPEASTRPGLQVGSLRADVSVETVLAALAEAAGRLATTAGEAHPLTFAASEHVHRSSAEDHAPHRLLARLDEGWMGIATRPRQLGAEIDRLLADITYVFGGAAPRLCVGMRSSLGPVPQLRRDPQLTLQLLGTRSVLVHGQGHPSAQHTTPAGAVLVVPAGCAVAHLPLDTDTAHVEVDLLQHDLLRGDPEALRERRSVAARAHDAMVPVVLHGDLGAARSAAGQIEDGWPMRLRAPGSAQVVSEADGLVTIAVGGMCVELTDQGAALLELLLDGRYASPREITSRLDADFDRVVAAMRRLWSAGLLDAEPPPMPLRSNDRLTQVAAVQLGDDAAGPFLAAVDPSAWRPAAAGEIPLHPAVDISVQALDSPTAPLDLVMQLVTRLNNQFLQMQLRPDRAEPALLVRVRPGNAGEAPGVLDAASLGSDLATGSTRKLTYVLSLAGADADGGWVHLPGGSDTADDAIGSLSVWASFRPWALRPLVSGERLLLVGRMHGPSFS